MTVGTVTIPLMKRAASGPISRPRSRPAPRRGQITPPVMGIAPHHAGVLQVPFYEVALAASYPRSVLKTSRSSSRDLEAKSKILPIQGGNPALGRVSKEGWYFLLPLRGAGLRAVRAEKAREPEMAGAGRDRSSCSRSGVLVPSGANTLGTFQSRRDACATRESRCDLMHARRPDHDSARSTIPSVWDSR